MIDQDSLKDILSYDSATGVFRWTRQRPRCKPGTRAGFILKGGKNCGYRYISLGGRSYGESTLAWLYVYGCFPDKEIDHINGIRYDNSISNLRLATRQQNCANTHRHKKSKTGFKGVSIDGVGFRARITQDGETQYLGHFGSAEKAHQAYITAAEMLFGIFARSA